MRDLKSASSMVINSPHGKYPITVLKPRDPLSNLEEVDGKEYMRLENGEAPTEMKDRLQETEPPRLKNTPPPIPPYVIMGKPKIKEKNQNNGKVKANGKNSASQRMN